MHAKPEGKGLTGGCRAATSSIGGAFRCLEYRSPESTAAMGSDGWWSAISKKLNETKERDDLYIKSEINVLLIQMPVRGGQDE